MTADPFADFTPDEPRAAAPTSKAAAAIALASRHIFDRSLRERRAAEGTDKPEADWFARIDEEVGFAVDRYGDGDPDVAAEVLWQIDQRLDEMAAAVKTAKAAIALRLISNVATHGAIRLGDTVYRAKHDRRRRHVDRDNTVQWLISQGGAQAIAEVYRLSEDVTRWGALDYWIDQAAEAAADDAMHAPGTRDDYVDGIRKAITDTLIEWVPGPKDGLQLDKLPASKAVWASKLEHLQRDETRKPKPQPADNPTPDPVESSPQTG